MRTSERTKFGLVLIAAAAMLASPAFAQHAAAPEESPWAMRAPSPGPQGAATPSPQQVAALKEAEKGTPAQRDLAHKVSEAIYNQDSAGLEKLFAPSTLKCIGKHQDYLKERIKRQFELPMNRNYQLTFSKLPPNVMKATKYVTYPMPPTHLMTMQFQAGSGSTATVNLTIGQEGGKWYEAQPCPTEAGLERFARIEQLKVKAQARAQQAATQVKEPVRSQIVAFAGKHDNVDAWKLCMATLKLDFPTCRDVVAIIAGNENN